jgi:hypothetical protein
MNSETTEVTLCPLSGHSTACFVALYPAARSSTGGSLASHGTCATSISRRARQTWSAGSIRASGVRNRELNRSKAHHQSRPRFELPGLQEVRLEGRGWLSPETQERRQRWMLGSYTRSRWLCEVTYTSSVRLVKAARQFDGLRSQGVRATLKPNFGSVTTQMTR